MFLSDNGKIFKSAATFAKNVSTGHNSEGAPCWTGFRVEV